MELTFFQGKDTFDAYAALICRKNKGITVIYVLGMIILALNCLITAAGDRGPFLLAMGLYFCFWAAFREKSYGDALYKNAPRYSADQQVTWQFDGDCFRFFSPLSNSAYRYEAVQSIMENDRIFALFMGKSAALLLDKRGMAPGAAEQLAALLTARTGRSVIRVKDKKNRRAILIAAAVAAAFIFTLGGHFAGVYFREHVSRPLSAYEYSIRVVYGFEQRDSDYYDLAADWEDKNAMLAVSWYSADWASTPRQALQWYCEGAQDITWGSLSDQTPTVTCNGGDEYCYFVTAVAGSDGWWLTEFNCPHGRAEEMLPRFAEWAETVKIQ